MWQIKYCLLVFIVHGTIGGPFPNFRSEFEFFSLDTDKDWWETASFYQIYPRSFKDSDGDGIGDIKGITEKLSHLKDIGITATWLSPIFKSPMKDFGYDISDFYDIQPEYGTMADFDALLQEAKKLGIKIILDFVPNHSSNECEWFKKSVKKEGKYTDYYVWHKGIPDPVNPTNRPAPPSNWISVFRGSAWEWNEERKEYYLHQFVAGQPDLNYRNRDVVEEMKNVLRFWLNKGVDGFRIDAVPHLFEKEPQNGNYEDEPISKYTNDTDDYGYLKHIYTVDQPETVKMVYEWREVMDEFQRAHKTETKVILAETWSPLDIVMQYYGDNDHEGAHIPFNFLFITSLNKDSSAENYVSTIYEWMNKMPKGRTANWVLGNHDKSRVATRFGTEKIDIMNMLLMTLPGASVNYNGEEIGMTDVWISWNDTVDPSACNSNPKIYEHFTRDPERTPFQWSAEKNAGFSTGTKTWLPISKLYKEVNLQKQKADRLSHFKIFQNMQNLRKSKTLQYGDFVAKTLSKNVFAVLRTLPGEFTYVFLANVGTEAEIFDLTTEGTFPNFFEYAAISINSIHRIGETVPTNHVPVLPNEGLVLKTKEKLTTLLGYYHYWTTQ